MQKAKAKGKRRSLLVCILPEGIGLKNLQHLAMEKDNRLYRESVRKREKEVVASVVTAVWLSKGARGRCLCALSL